MFRVAARAAQRRHAQWPETQCRRESSSRFDAGSGETLWKCGLYPSRTPCADLATTTESGRLPNTRGRCRGHRHRATVAATDRRRPRVGRQGQRVPPRSAETPRAHRRAGSECGSSWPRLPRLSAFGSIARLRARGIRSVRRMRQQVGMVFAQSRAFMRQGFAHGRAKAGVCQPMERVSLCRQKSSCQFVLALGTRLESPQPVAQAVLDALVVANLEMQTGNRFAAAPVTAVQRVVAAQQQGGGYPAARTPRPNHQYAVAKRAAEMTEECLCQRRVISLFGKSGQVKLVHSCPVSGVKFVASDDIALHTRRSNAFAF